MIAERVNGIIALALLIASAMLAPSAYAQTYEAENPDLAPFFALQEQEQRVLSIGYRLLKANSHYCDQYAVNIGWQLHGLDQYGDQSKAQAAFGFVSDYPSISALVNDGAAARAGLQPGDTILSIFAQGDMLIWPTTETQQAEESQAIIASRLMADLPLESEDITIAIQRNGEQLYIPLETDFVCATRFQLKPTKKRSAATDGNLITITTAMVEITRSDEDLATILAHEIAHNLLKHPDKLDAAGVDGGIFGPLGRDASIIKETEIEADRLAVWLMANAGFDPEGAVRFWTHYGKRYGKGIFSAPTHYRWKKRVGLFEEEIAAMATTPRDENDLLPPPLLVNATSVAAHDTTPKD